jgi:hypothetical protein
VVLTHLPEHHPAQVMLSNVVRLDRQRLRIIVGDEGPRGPVPQIRCLGAIVPTANESCSSDQLLPEFRIAVLGLEPRVGLIDPGVERLTPVKPRP